MKPYDDADLQLWTWLSRTRDAIFKARVKELHKYHTSSIQSSFMHVILALGEKATPTEISRWLFRERHSISEFINRMEKHKFLQKFRDLNKKNMFRVQLTEKGMRAYNQSNRLESIHSIMSVLSREEREQLVNILQKLWFKVLKDLNKEAIPPFPYQK